MPRPQRCRRICKEPECFEFFPNKEQKIESVILLYDEFEVIRLVDWENQTHEQCAAQMDISRTTVTEIYESARKKLADCLVNGKSLLISGGNYRMCDGSSFVCCRKDCQKRNQNKIVKGDSIMRIAVTYENGEVFQHFGHCEQFKFYDVVNGEIIKSQIVDTNGSGHGALVSFLAANKTDMLICGGIGGGAQAALAEVRIQLYGGVSGMADKAVESYLAGNLIYKPDVRCSHHDNEHGDESHICGEHGCGHHCK